MFDFTRGPPSATALTVCVPGTLWRLHAVLRRPAQADPSAPRDGASSRTNAALGAIVRGLRPRRAFGAAARVATVEGIAMPIGRVLIVFGCAPHIAFIHRLHPSPSSTASPAPPGRRCPTR